MGGYIYWVRGRVDWVGLENIEFSSYIYEVNGYVWVHVGVRKYLGVNDDTER